MLTQRISDTISFGHSVVKPDEQKQREIVRLDICLSSMKKINILKQSRSDDNPNIWLIG
jgi:hypothetical protein